MYDEEFSIGCGLGLMALWLACSLVWELSRDGLG